MFISRLAANILGGCMHCALCIIVQCAMCNVHLHMHTFCFPPQYLLCGHCKIILSYL